MDITDDKAFEVLQQVLAGQRRVPLNGKSSQVLSVLLQMEVDAQVTPEWFKVWLGPRSPRPMEYYRELAPAAVSELMNQADVGSIQTGTLICLPTGRVETVRLAPGWAYPSRVIWFLPGRDEVCIRTRRSDQALEAPSVEPCPEESPLVPPALPFWKPPEKKWRTFDPALPCPRCRVSSDAYRDCDTYLVCEECGCSFEPNGIA